MTYMDASDDACTAALMLAARGFTADQVTSAAATLIAMSVVGANTQLPRALDDLDRCVEAARHEIEINFNNGIRRQVS